MSSKDLFKRAFVWNRDAVGLRAFGLDFGPFAVVVLRDDKEQQRMRAEIAWHERHKGDPL